MKPSKHKKNSNSAKLPLDIADIELLENSFAQIEPRLPAFSRSFYANLFLLYPEIKLLFGNTDMEAQSQKLVESLILVVINLHKPDILTQTLRNLGARHIKYGALPEHYYLVGNALLTTFEQYLRSDWTPEVKQAWVDAYSVITEIMLDGAEHSQEEVALDVLIKTKENTETSSKNSDAAELPLDIELLESSFERIRPRLSEFSLTFYANLFIIYPETKPLFANTDMEAQSQKLVESLILVVLNLRKPDILTQTLRNLGTRHIEYGALPEYYPLVGNALLTTFEQYLRSDWTPQVKQAWVDAYNLISQIMLEGANYSPSDITIERVQITNQSPENTLLRQKNDDSFSEVNTTLHLADRATKNKFSWELFTAFLAGGVLILLLILV